MAVLGYDAMVGCGMVKSVEHPSYNPELSLKVTDKVNDMVVPPGCDRTAVDAGNLIHPYPDEWPWLLVTPSAAYRCGLLEGLSEDSAMRLLSSQAIVAVQRQFDAGHLLGRFEVEGTIIGTVVVTPNSEGGMTIGYVYE